MRNCGRKSVIVDPFCGSGTVPLTAVAEAYHAVAFEVNPFLAFVARAKLSSPPAGEVAKLASIVEKGIDRGAHSLISGASTFTERDGLDKSLFNTDVMRRFEEDGARQR